MEDTYECFAPALMREIRDRFAYVDRDPFAGQRIFFESAGGTLRLRSVVEAVHDYTGYPDNPGRNNKASRAIEEVLTRGREDIALLLGVKRGIIISGQSTTSIVFRVMNTLVIEGKRRLKREGKEKGNIVTTSLDHPATYDSARILSARYGLEFRTAELDPSSGKVLPEALLSKIDENTVVLTMIHVSNITGTRNDIISMNNLVKKRNPNTFILIDGAQHACHAVIDVDMYGADAYVFSPYKMYSKMGASFAHLSPRTAALPHDKLIGKEQDQWDMGTLEPAAFLSMTRVAEYYNWLGKHFSESDDPRKTAAAGMKAIENHERALLSLLLNGKDDVPGMLSMPAVRIAGQTDGVENRVSILSFTLENKNSGEIVEHFNQKGIRLHNRIPDAYSKHVLDAMGITECVRLSLCHYNNEEEVLRFLTLLKEYSG